MGQCALDITQPQYDFLWHAENIKTQKVLKFGKENSLKDEIINYLARKVHPDHLEKEQVIQHVIKSTFGILIAHQDDEDNHESIELDDGYIT